MFIPFVSFAQTDSIQTSDKDEIIITCKKCGKSKKPLYIVDGKEMKETEVLALNSKDIESINVLKGEKAIEKYGEAGKNGAIEIYLKKDSLNLTEILNGIVPGLKNLNSSQPELWSFRCGLPSMDLRNGKPLYVVDGVPQKINYSQDEISTNEIANIIVLKNAEATALYGNNGRNGVIIVTTKKYLDELEAKKIEYDLAVSDLGYESFLSMQPSARSYSLNYLQNKNRHYVSVWNQRVTSGNPEIYEMPIDYDSKTYYGLDFEYKLFVFFKFMEDKHKISFI